MAGLMGLAPTCSGLTSRRLDSFDFRPREMSQSPVPPRAGLAYEAWLNAGSTAGKVASPAGLAPAGNPP